MAWCRSGDKPISEVMVFSLLTHICVTRPQGVKERSASGKQTELPPLHVTNLVTSISCVESGILVTGFESSMNINIASSDDKVLFVLVLCWYVLFNQCIFFSCRIHHRNVWQQHQREKVRDCLLIGPFGINSSKTWIKVHKVSVKEIHLKMQKNCIHFVEATVLPFTC